MSPWLLYRAAEAAEKRVWGAEWARDDVERRLQRQYGGRLRHDAHADDAEHARLTAEYFRLNRESLYRVVQRVRLADDVEYFLASQAEHDRHAERLAEDVARAIERATDYALSGPSAISLYDGGRTNAEIWAARDYVEALRAAPESLAA